MNDHDLIKIREICHKIRCNTPACYEWEWDEKFEMAHLVFTKDAHADRLLSIILEEFNRQLDFDALVNSYGSIEKIIISNFGIVPGQIFFTLDENGKFLLLAAWWPWGNSENISLRIGLLKSMEHKYPNTDIKIKEYLSDLLDISEWIAF